VGGGGGARRAARREEGCAQRWEMRLERLCETGISAAFTHLAKTFLTYFFQVISEDQKSHLISSREKDLAYVVVVR